MRIVAQRVSRASVKVEGETVGSIDTGLLVLLGISRTDTTRDADYLVDKTLGLRIFPDKEGKMNRSVVDIGGAVLVVSQFTLYGDCRKGRRPAFDRAAAPEHAKQLYQYFIDVMKGRGVTVATGLFQAMMEVELVNNGPVTLIFDSEKSI